MDKLREDIRKFLINNKDNELVLRGQLTDYCLHENDSIRISELKLQREALQIYFKNIVDILKDLELEELSSYIFTLSCLKSDLLYILSQHDITQSSELLGNINTKFKGSIKFSTLFY